MKRATWNDVRLACSSNGAPENQRVFGIPRGGIPIALLLESESGCVAVDRPQDAEFIVDDIRDSGRTAVSWGEKYRKPVWCAFTKQEGDEWLEMPWERYEEQTGAEEAATRLLQALNAPLGKEGMAETPARLVRSLRELSEGYVQKPAAILSKRFPVTYDEMIVVRGIEFWSLCEHHLLPFHGSATVGYVPGEGGVVGLSKLSRLVHCFSRRFQIQERLTAEIAEAIETHLKPMGVGVVLRASHLCMAMRGVRTPADLVTSDLRGALRDPTPRAEFLALERGA